MPEIRRPLANQTQALGHLAVDLRDDGPEQALLVAEVVVERAAREADRGGELVHRRSRIALFREDPARGGDELVPGLGHRLGPPPSGDASRARDFALDH